MTARQWQPKSSLALRGSASSPITPSARSRFAPALPMPYFLRIHAAIGVVVTDGLKEGEKVIVEGVQKVRPKTVVIAKPYQEPKADTAGS